MSSAVKEQEELRVGAPGKNRMCYGRSVIIPMAVVTDSHQLSGSKQHKLNNSLMVLEAGFLPLTRFTWKALELVGHEQLRLLLQRSHILEGPVILSLCRGPTGGFFTAEPPGKTPDRDAAFILRPILGPSSG
ncbi:uncharacterized protein LOC129629324 isoform X4 [Bubalus kerabau]|uniref:uncharacterized protein LOC129629324 isoform X4 n=1 Tax=Bubalus carabanensis TaxID=3119969 RepID=UPI00244ED97E|nr:uncharacterized protein LOC129629324 isoform X4 [Bubalus carabanensis]